MAKVNTEPESQREHVIDVSTPEGQAYLLALVDQAPCLSSRDDYPDPLTSWWKDTIRLLLRSMREYRDDRRHLIEVVDHVETYSNDPKVIEWVRQRSGRESGRL